MASATDFPTAGKVTAVKDGIVVFNPRGTTYELSLKPAELAAAPVLNAPTRVHIHADARKVWTVPSGGAFIVPIEGPPKIVQGRVRFRDDRHLVVSAGANFIFDLPAEDSAFDLASGSIELGVLVNVTAFAGAKIEFLTEAAATR